MKRTYVAVSEMQDFLRCQWRWYAKYRLNRVPRRWSDALILGTAVHNVFEKHFKGDTLEGAWQDEVMVLDGARLMAKDPSEAVAIVKAKNSLILYKPQIVGFVDQFRIDESLEVEEAFEIPLGTFNYDGSAFVLQGRPDQAIRVGDVVYHRQHKTIAPNKGLETYAKVIARSMHEGLYGNYLSQKYNGSLTYGGTALNVIIKKVVDDPRKGSFQTIIKVDGLERFRAFLRAQAITREMARAAEIAERCGHLGLIDNPLEDAGAFGNSLDGYYHVLTGQRKLSDDAYFMDREERYVPIEGD